MLARDAVWLGKWEFVVSFGCPSVTEPFLSTSGCCWEGTGGYTRFRVCWHVTPCRWIIPKICRFFFSIEFIPTCLIGMFPSNTPIYYQGLLHVSTL